MNGLLFDSPCIASL